MEGLALFSNEEDAMAIVGGRVCAPLGPVSSGTMRPKDLIPRFMDVLDALREELMLSDGPMVDVADIVKEVGRLDDVLAEIEEQSAFVDYYEGEDSSWDLELLEEELQAFAPPFCYFGASEGDGACYGFWLMWDTVQEAVQDGTIIRMESGAEWPADELSERPDCDGVLYVTDHGNCTLYDPTGEPFTEIWSIV